MSGYSIFAIVSFAMATVKLVVLPYTMDQEPVQAAQSDRQPYPHVMGCSGSQLVSEFDWHSGFHHSMPLQSKPSKMVLSAAVCVVADGNVQYLMSYPTAVAGAVSHILLQDHD